MHQSTFLLAVSFWRSVEAPTTKPCHLLNAYGVLPGYMDTQENSRKCPNIAYMRPMSKGGEFSENIFSCRIKSGENERLHYKK